MKKIFVSFFDIGEVPRSPGKWKWNWLYFLPFIFTFEQGEYVLLCILAKIAKFYPSIYSAFLFNWIKLKLLSNQYCIKLSYIRKLNNIIVSVQSLRIQNIFVAIQSDFPHPENKNASQFLDRIIQNCHWVAELNLSKIKFAKPWNGQQA